MGLTSSEITPTAPTAGNSSAGGSNFSVHGQVGGGSVSIKLPDYASVMKAEADGQLTLQEAIDTPVSEVVTTSQSTDGDDPVMHGEDDLKDVFTLTVARLSVYQGFSDNGYEITNVAPVNYDGTYAYPGWSVSNISTSTSQPLTGVRSAQSSTEAVFSLGYQISLEPVNADLTFYFYGNNYWTYSVSGNVS